MDLGETTLCSSKQSGKYTTFLATRTEHETNPAEGRQQVTLQAGSGFLRLVLPDSRFEEYEVSSEEWESTRRDKNSFSSQTGSHMKIHIKRALNC